MLSPLRNILLVLPLYCLLTLQAEAQVTIAPTELFIDEQNRFGTFMVMNNSDQTQEVNLDFLFGYPATDNTGNTYMRYDDEEAEALYSASEWIRGFPRVFILEPGARQTVRLTVRPPADIPDGMYWTRIKTTSNPVTPDLVDGVGDNVSARLTFRVEQITTGFYKKGAVTTGLEVANSQIHIEENKAAITTGLSRTGNAPFIGRKKLQVLNESGDVVFSHEKNTTVYLKAVRKIEYDISEWPAGRYSAEITFVTERRNISSRDLAQSDPISETVYFTINER